MMDTVSVSRLYLVSRSMKTGGQDEKEAQCTATLGEITVISQSRTQAQQTIVLTAECRDFSESVRCAYTLPWLPNDLHEPGQFTALLKSHISFYELVWLKRTEPPFPLLSGQLFD